jgi:hypothetical protein
METVPRHQCLIYNGAPSRQLPALASVIRSKLQQNIRCLYLNSLPMVTGMRSALWAAGVDVGAELAKGSLVCSSDRSHLKQGQFEPESMIRMLEVILDQAIRDGFAGLWATGDMSWEMGPSPDFQSLVEYEWRLDKFLEANPKMGGICQYHADILPRQVLRQGLVVHPGIFVNETLQLVNPDYVRVERLAAVIHRQETEATLECRCSTGND